MARYKPYNLKQDKWIALSYGDQIVPGSFGCDGAAAVDGRAETGVRCG